MPISSTGCVLEVLFPQIAATIPIRNRSIRIEPADIYTEAITDEAGIPKRVLAPAADA
jgi:hypothetical protein